MSDRTKAPAMALHFETFSNTRGGNVLYKALSHPLAARRMADLLTALAGQPVCLYDLSGHATALAELYDLGALEIEGVYVQDVEAVGRCLLGHEAQPITALSQTTARTLLIVDFDAERPLAQIRHLLPAGIETVSLDALRLPDEALTEPARYLDARNFATNIAFFRDDAGLHSRLVTTNYWGGYGAADPRLWCCLFDADGAVLAEWHEALPPADGLVVLDSAEIRARFGLPAFTGQLFVHAQRIAGHDIVKYALDTYGDAPTALSCTHDANAWPADYYAGLPAPGRGERVLLWLQNSHPVAIPAGALGLRRMGGDRIVPIDGAIPAFATRPVDVGAVLPELAWPAQIEVVAGKHCVRPRYEIEGAAEHRRIAHVNVQRSDLAPDPKIRELGGLMGKGYLLPAPVLSPARYRSLALPTPMALGQASLPTALRVYDRDGREVARKALGNLPRDHETVLDAAAMLAEAGAAPGPEPEPEIWGHMELVYDFAAGGEADGWLHGLFRYEDLASGHAADTSFGAHIFNTPLTYRGEPQSYAGRPPGLSTRLFLRLGEPALETFCHLIYPASTAWHATSETQLLLYDGEGRQVATADLAIPCGGSRLFRVAEVFSHEALAATEGRGHVLVRDRTCRLFGYHGLRNAVAFSLDHMFGF